MLLYIHDDSLYSVRSLYFCIIFVFLFLYLLKYGGSVLPNILAVRNYLNYLNLFISFHYSGNSLFIYKVYTCSFYKLINLHLVTLTYFEAYYFKFPRFQNQDLKCFLIKTFSVFQSRPQVFSNQDL